jgi:dihydrofolate synthase / folylpolyglutamate synthase
LFKLPKFGAGPCLERLARLLQSLGIDRKRLSERSVVICGSNGKGSTAAFCESIGRHLGLKVGLFTSPHLFDFTERFQIDRQPILEGVLATYLKRITASIAADPQGNDFGSFEAQFALAALYFQEQACDLQVFEAGIGGRLDPVRLVESKYVAVTSLDLEHTELLGQTLLDIGLDKSDACAPQGTVFYGANCANFADQLRAFNQTKSRRSVFSSSSFIAPDTLSLAGAFQRENAQVAQQLMRAWWQETLDRNSRFAPCKLDFEALSASALIQTQWPGRLQPISLNPLVVIDVGHTPDGVSRALQGLESSWPSRSWTCVVGVSIDKDCRAILQLLVQQFNQFVVTRALHKGTPSEQIVHQIKAIALQYGKTVQIDCTDNTRDACAWVRNHTLDSVYVAGGLFVAVEFWQEWRGANAHDLTFF